MYFIVPGEPKGKARPRASNGHFYNPRESAQYENLVRACYRKASGKHLGDIPIEIKINCYMTIPKSFSRRKREEARNKVIRPTKKPDCDNVAKIILDSLNHVAYDDDKQVISLTVSKYYGEEPRVEVYINE